MTPDRIHALLAAYGADPMRWPVADRAAASAARSAPAMRALFDEARTLDALIDRHASPPLPQIDAAALVARVTATPQPRGYVVRPAAAPRRRLAGWLFAFGWPNVAGLASVALIGFFVGWMDFDGTAAQADNDEPASGIFGVFEDLPW